MGTIHYYNELMKAMNSGNETLQFIMNQPEGGELVELPNGSEVIINEHDWEEISGSSEAQQKVLKAQAIRAMNEAASQTKNRGTVPGEIETLLKNLNYKEPPKFDWRGYIKRFSGKSVRIYTKKSRRKLNKRYYENPGLKIKQLKHILVAIDTSASVNNEELKEFIQEINHLYKTGNDVTIVHADTAISKIEPFNPKGVFTVYGRGGTDFNPVVDYFEENRRKYSCLIYFTDGEACIPKNGKKDLLWVLSAESKMNSSLPGMVIQLN